MRKQHNTFISNIRSQKRCDNLFFSFNLDYLVLGGEVSVALASLDLSLNLSGLSLVSDSSVVCGE